MIKNQNIVCIGNTTWFGEYQKSTVQILSRLAKYNNILYVDYAFTFKDVIFGLFGKTNIPVKQMLGINNRLSTLITNTNGKVVKLTLPPVFPFNHFKNEHLFRIVLKINSHIIASSIKRAMRKLKMDEVISIAAFMPFYGLFLKNKLKEKINIYYCYDSIDEHRNGPRGKIYETEYVKNIDGVIVTSDNLAYQLTPINPNVFVVKNGVDFKMFCEVVKGHIKSLNPKVVCYTGSIDQRFETEMVEYCITKAPDYEFIFVGPVRNKVAAETLSKYNNVKIKPPVPPEEIPLIMFKSHVGIIPYTRTLANKNVYPLKINEYLSVGTPVVMTDFAQLNEFDELISVASNNEQFFNKIIYEIDSDTPEKQQFRLAFAAKNSWENRAELFSDAIQSMLEKKYNNQI
jgi:teichuronic acid biosynthesis glycosyltransferase TuaH